MASSHREVAGKTPADGCPRSMCDRADSNVPSHTVRRRIGATEKSNIGDGLVTHPWNCDAQATKEVLEGRRAKGLMRAHNRSITHMDTMRASDFSPYLDDCRPIQSLAVSPGTGSPTGAARDASPSPDPVRAAWSFISAATITDTLGAQSWGLLQLLDCVLASHCSARVRRRPKQHARNGEWEAFVCLWRPRAGSIDTPSRKRKENSARLAGLGPALGHSPHSQRPGRAGQRPKGGERCSSEIS